MKGLVHYNYKDVLRGFRYGFSLKKSFIAFVIFLVPSIPWLLGYELIAYFLLVPAYMFAKLVVSKLVFEQLKGDEFYPIYDALEFSVKKILSYVAFILVSFVLLLLLGSLFALLLWISKMHAILVLIVYVPAFILFALLIYVLVGILLSETVGFPSIAVQEFDAFDILFESLSLFNSQIYRYLAYKLLNLTQSALAFLITYAFFSYLNALLMDTNAGILTFIQAFSFAFSVYTCGDFLSYLVFIYKRDGTDLIASISSRTSEERI